MGLLHEIAEREVEKEGPRAFSARSTGPMALWWNRLANSAWEYWVARAVFAIVVTAAHQHSLLMSRQADRAALDAGIADWLQVGYHGHVRR